MNYRKRQVEGYQTQNLGPAGSRDSERSVDRDVARVPVIGL